VRHLFSSRHNPPRQGQRGATAVEFSLIFPLLVLMTIGTMDGARMVVSRAMLSYAVICGARKGLVSTTTTTTIAQTALTAAAPMLPLTGISITTSAASWAARTSGDTVTVTASYTFQPSLPAFTKLATKNFHATSTLTIP
jgi:Flp pilus assembly protein TadG